MILVTGAAGTVGSEVVKALSGASASFRVGYRNRKPSASAEAVQLDLERPETIGPSLAGVDTVSTIDVRDVAAVAVRALTSSAHDGQAYELSGPESLSSAEMAATLTRVLGREIRYVAVSPEDYKKGALAAGVPEAYADAALDLYQYYRTGAAAAVTPTVREVTGREPIRFEQFARDHAAALR